MSRHSVLFALLSFALLSHFFRTDVASHCWHSHIWHSHSCLIRTVDPFALLAFALLAFPLLASHWCRSHFCLSHCCRTSLISPFCEKRDWGDKRTLTYHQRLKRMLFGFHCNKMLTVPKPPKGSASSLREVRQTWSEHISKVLQRGEDLFARPGLAGRV